MLRRWLLLATLAAYLPAAALPGLAGRDDLPGGAVDPGVLVVPFCLGFALAFPAWGRWADRRDAAWVVRVALIATAVAGAAVALAPSAWALAVARGLQGLAAAGVPPAAQAELARAAAAERTGRALSPMMLAVAVATVAGPAVALLLAGGTGWTAAALVLGSLLPLALALVPARGAAPAPSRDRSRRPYADAGGVRAGWLVSALVLGGHWTVLTRLAEALGREGLQAGPQVAGLAALTGVAGLPLVVAAARASDLAGPRRTMTLTLAAGATGFLLASRATGVAMFVCAAGTGLAVYWAYLPVVAAQVQRSAGAAARGRAAGGLYASMWTAAAAAGALASLAPGWREVLLGAGVAWALAAVVAARRFLGPAVPAPAPAVPAGGAPAV